MNKEFAVHKLNEAGFEKVNATASAFDVLLETLKSFCNESREFSITKTKLEEAAFFAKKSIAAQPENQIEIS